MGAGCGAPPRSAEAVSVQLGASPLVTDDAVEFALADPRLRSVALVSELRGKRHVEFVRDGRAWRLAFARPEVDRFEYLLELTYRTGRRSVGPDPANPLRAPGPFGEKSVVEFPGYQHPAWVTDEEAAHGTLRELRLDSLRLRSALPALLWSAADTDPARPLPLLLVHDGPEYADYSSLVRLLDHLVDFGEVPELRAALLPPPGDRNESYSASARYANALAADIVPAVIEQSPTDRPPVLMGASLGALAAVHAHFRNPGLLGGLFLQSGSFFRRRFDSHEAGFGRFARITRFVGQVHGRSGFVPPVPATLTCGAAEENLDNNRALASALRRRGWDARTAWTRDAHNWISWRDALHPHLAELLLRAWT
jgi:enterochelin esterase family protein